MIFRNETGEHIIVATCDASIDAANIVYGVYVYAHGGMSTADAMHAKIPDQAVNIICISSSTLISSI